MGKANILKTFLGFYLDQGQGLAAELGPSPSFPANTILKCFSQCAPLSVKDEILTFNCDPCLYRALHSAV